MAKGVDWKKVTGFVGEHWPYFVVGLVVIVGIFYTMGSGSSATSTAPTSTTGTTDPNYLAGLQASEALAGQNAQLQAANIAGQVQQNTAQIAANANVQESNASAASAAYIATVQAESNTANYAAAAAAGQNIQALNSVTQGFSAYAGSLAQQTAADATAAAGVANSNDQTAAATLGAAFSGAAALTGALNTAGLLGNTPIRNNFSLLPTLSGFTNLTAPVIASPGYVDSGSFQFA